MYVWLQRYDTVHPPDPAPPFLALRVKNICFVETPPIYHIWRRAVCAQRAVWQRIRLLHSLHVTASPLPMITMHSWSQLYCLLVLALSFQSARAFLAPPLLPHQNHLSLRQARCHGGVLCIRPGAARRLPSRLPAGAQHSRRRASTPRSFPEEASAATVGGLLRGDSVHRCGRRGASTALALGANEGMRGEGAEERSPVGGGDGGGKGGWRQRIVRTIMTVFLTVRAMVALTASRLGLGRPGAVRKLR